MKDIFADLYNKVLKFFNKADEQNESKDVACNRLKLVLMQDRTNLSPAIMDRMRRELIELLSKYMELDKELLDLSFEHEDEQMALMLSIPVVRAKTEEEIQAILDKEDEEKRLREEAEEGEVEEDDEADEDVSDEDDEDEADEEDSDDEEESEEESSEVSEEEPVKKKKTKKAQAKEEDDSENSDENDKKEKFFKTKEEGSVEE